MTPNARLQREKLVGVVVVVVANCRRTLISDTRRFNKAAFVEMYIPSQLPLATFRRSRGRFS